MLECVQDASFEAIQRIKALLSVLEFVFLYGAGDELSAHTQMGHEKLLL